MIPRARTPNLASPLLIAVSIMPLLASRPCVCNAASTNAPPEPRPVGRQVQQDISRWDLNQNGRLDAEEAEAFRRDKLRERQQQLELRQKAAIEARKLEAARSGIPRRVPPALLTQYDANTNGILDPDEWTKYREDLEKRKAARLQSQAATNAPPSPAPPAPSQPARP